MIVFFRKIILEPGIFLSKESVIQLVRLCHTQISNEIFLQSINHWLKVPLHHHFRKF